MADIFLSYREDKFSKKYFSKTEEEAEKYSPRWNKLMGSHMSVNPIIDITPFEPAYPFHSSSIVGYATYVHDLLKEDDIIFLTSAEADIRQFSGYVQDRFTSAIEIESQTLYCQILEVHSDFIVVDALIDKKSFIHQKRKFDRKPLEGVINISLGEIFVVTIQTMPGERRFIYSKAEEETREIFKRSFIDHFLNLKNSNIFKPAKTNDKNDF